RGVPKAVAWAMADQCLTGRPGALPDSMSAGRSTIEHMFALKDEGGAEGPAARDLRRGPDERLADQIVQIAPQIPGLPDERMLRIAELDRRKRVRGEGRVATASWLARTLGVSFTCAKDDVRVGRALEAMPAASAALADGELSTAAVRALVTAREEQPDGF